MTAAPEAMESDAAALAEMLATGVVRLTEPVLGAAGPIHELTFHRPRLGEMRGVRFRLTSGGADIDIAEIITVAARLTNQPEAVIDQLCAPDALQIGAIVVGFFMGSQKVGAG